VVASSDGSADSDSSALGLPDAAAVSLAVAAGGCSVGDGDAAGEAHAARMRARMPMSAADRCMGRKAPLECMVVVADTPPVTTPAVI
jgi:hypothetical protein